MTIKALYPTARPSLDLDFANTRCLDPRITFSRASTATFVGADGLIQTAATNVARFDHDPTTGESLGLLAEAARANLITYSEQLNNTGWFKNLVTVSANAGVAPDGTFTADQVSNTPNSTSYCRPTVSISNTTTYTFSLYVKPLTTNKSLIFETTGGQVVFNLTTLTTSGPGARQIVPVANGWYRIVWTFTGISGLGGFPQFPTLFIGGWPTTSDSVSFLFWGTQVEAGSFPTSYIPTSGSTATRVADVASMTGTNFSSWYNNTEGTFVTDAILAFTQNAGNPFTFGGVFYTVVNDPYGFGAIRTLGNGQIMNGGLSNSLTSFSKTAVALKSGDFAIGRGGSITGTSSTAYTPTGSQWRINSSLGSLAVIKRLAYYPVRLPNAQLQALTAT